MASQPDSASWLFGFCTVVSAPPWKISTCGAALLLDGSDAGQSPAPLRSEWASAGVAAHQAPRPEHAYINSLEWPSPAAPSEMRLPPRRSCSTRTCSPSQCRRSNPANWLSGWPASCCSSTASSTKTSPLNNVCSYQALQRAGEECDSLILSNSGHAAAGGIGCMMRKVARYFLALTVGARRSRRLSWQRPRLRPSARGKRLRDTWDPAPRRPCTCGLAPRLSNCRRDGTPRLANSCRTRGTTSLQLTCRTLRR
jgi:hypothetical protein